LAKIQALLVFRFGFVCRQKPNVLECAVGCLFTMRHNGSGLGDSGGILALRFNRSTKVQI